jgi:hypothetical protein
MPLRFPAIANRLHRATTALRPSDVAGKADALTID